MKEMKGFAGMNIQIATEADYAEVMTFYQSMCEELAKRSFLHMGNQGGYPSASMVKDAIRDGGMIIGVEQGAVIAAMILNHTADTAYGKVKWQIDATSDEVTIMHALRVSPKHSGRGHGRAMVDNSIRLAKHAGQRAIRLDTLDENTIAQKLYRAMGFSFIDTVEIEYMDIGEPRTLYCYELVL